MSRRHISDPRTRTIRRSFAALAALVSLVVVATALPASVAAQGGRRNPDDIQGRWQLLEYRDTNGEMVSVPPGIGATLIPWAGFIEVSAACSDYFAPYEQPLQALFITEPEEIDRVTCDAAAQDVDDALFADLLAAATADKSGSILEISDAIEEPLLTLTNAIIPTDPTIARWDLARVGAADGSNVSVIQGTEPWIEFLRGGRVVGSSGCGSFLGNWENNDTSIRVHDVAYRIDACTEPVERQAQTLLDTFAEVTDFQMLPAGLTLEDAEGTTRLAWTPAIELGNRTWTPLAIFDGDGKRLPVSDFMNTSAVRFGGGRTSATATVDGRSYCRGFDARGLISGLALSVSGVQSLAGPCASTKDPEDIDDVAKENGFLETLKRTSSHALRGSELELMDADGRAIMRLVPQADLVGPTWVVTRMAPKRAPQGPTPLTARFEDVEDLGIVQGDTGAVGPGGTNGYLADYAIPGAAQINIQNVSTDGRACPPKKANGPLCKQERTFLALLEQADGFIVRDYDLRLFKGARPILFLVPEAAEAEDVPAVPSE